MYEAIILAGGLGTRLRPAVADLPKVMAPIGDKPFLHYVLEWLHQHGVTRIVMAVGYKANIIEDYLSNNHYPFEFIISKEEEPLGTGGAIQLALNHLNSEHVMVVNGDTFFTVDLDLLFDFHEMNHADLTVALKEMEDFDRYGTVSIDMEYNIYGFKEKEYCARGYINGGIYMLKRSALEHADLPEKFSFEKDFMEKYCNELHFKGLSFEDYFIDIGVPDDYEKAKKELPNLVFGFR